MSHDVLIFTFHKAPFLQKTNYFKKKFNQFKISLIVSTYVVTICDAGPSLGCENFVLILARIPYSAQARLPPPPMT